MARVKKDVLMRGRKVAKEGWKWTRYHGDMVRAAKKQIEALQDFIEIFPTRPKQSVVSRLTTRIAKAANKYQAALMSTIGPDFTRAYDRYQVEFYEFYEWSPWCAWAWRTIFDDVDRDGVAETDYSEWIRGRYWAAFEDMRDRMGWDVEWEEDEEKIVIRKADT
jgi:hypothetical protein